jgi:hypothetical protein
MISQEILLKKINSIGSYIMDKNTSLEIFENKIKSNSNVNKELGIVIIYQKLIYCIGNYIRVDILW